MSAPRACCRTLLRRLALLLLSALIAAAVSGCRNPAVKRPKRLHSVHVRQASEVLEMDVAPDGRGAACLDTDGVLHVFKPDGNEVLRRSFPGAVSFCLAEGADRVIIAGKQRKSWWIRIVDDRGNTIWRQTERYEVLGVSISPSGNTAFASLRGARMLVFDLHGSPKWRRIRTDLNLSKITYCPVADALLTVTSNPPGFAMVALDGHTRWWKDRPPGWFRLKAASEGSLLLTTIEHPSPEGRFEFAAYSASGQRLFEQQVTGYEPRVAASSDGTRIALSYRRKLERKGRSVMERRVGLWTTDGVRLWEMGGLFFRPVLVGMVENPLGVVVAEDYTLLSALDSSGRLAWRGPSLGGRLERIVHDPGWSLAWAQLRDGSLNLWSL